MHLISPYSYHFWNCDVILLFFLSLSFTCIILVSARRSLFVVFPALKIGEAKHDLSVQVDHPRIDRCNSWFFPYTSNLWNYLPPSVFPSSSICLSCIKCRVYWHPKGIDWVSLFYRILVSYNLFTVGPCWGPNETVAFHAYIEIYMN